jgi:hypothetical protein
MITKREKWGLALILTVITLSSIGIYSQGPIPQNPEYHLFKDARRIWGIPNFWNVISNLPFLVVGAWGLFKLKTDGALKIVARMKLAYFLFFFGVISVSFGSGYYHLRPSNQTLFWDRLPMAIAFMALFSVVISEFISIGIGKVMLWPLIAGGIFSVAYWHYTELWGQGDLRSYGLVQFLPMLLMPIILIFFRSKCSRAAAYWWLLLAYATAKVFEHFDGQIYVLIGLTGGHAVKHIVAALGVYVLLYAYQRRVCT